MLTRLHLENTALTDAATPYISNLNELEYLNLYGTEVSDASVSNLAKLRKPPRSSLANEIREREPSLEESFVDTAKFNL